LTVPSNAVTDGTEWILFRHGYPTMLRTLPPICTGTAHVAARVSVSSDGPRLVRKRARVTERFP